MSRSSSPTSPGVLLPALQPVRSAGSSPVTDLAAASPSQPDWSYTARFARTRKSEGRVHFGIGIVVSACAHLCLVAFSGNPPERVAQPVASLMSTEAELFEMPEPEPILVDTADAPAPETLSTSFAPPSQAELPGLVSVDAFLQVMQAPAPAGLIGAETMTTLPPVMPASHQQVATTQLFDIKDLDRVPKRVRTVVPIYPSELKRARVEGEVLLLVVIDQAGRVRVNQVLESTAREFADAAVTAAEQCRFESPVKNGAVVAASYQMRVPFRISTTIAMAP